ncbi:MAG TPA: PPOX class F420-dependent oxidoreductase [Acidimicrobiales bacterium]|nr:PPOX class F420-dependent oxidoreductase [Acidimicrobiales bacterium]
MEIADAVRFVAGNHRAVLATRRADGRPQLSPVSVGVDGEGRVLISTRETAMKLKNIERDPAVSVCVFTDAFFGEWVQLDGTAEVVRLPEAMDLLVAYYRDLAGEHPDWDDYRAAMERDRRVIVRITVDRAGPDRAG